MTSTVSEAEESSLFKELFTTVVLEQEHKAATTYCLPVYFSYQSETVWFSPTVGFCRCFTCTWKRAGDSRKQSKTVTWTRCGVYVIFKPSGLVSALTVLMCHSLDQAFRFINSRHHCPLTLFILTKWWPIISLKLYQHNRRRPALATSSMYTITNTHLCTQTHIHTHTQTNTHSLTIGAGSPVARQVKVAVLPSDTVVLTGSSVMMGRTIIK